MATSVAGPEATAAGAGAAGAAAAGGATGGGAEGEGGVDSKIPKLEIIKGRKYPYSYSALGDLERYLDGMPTNKLNI